jgi:hypothetical protein
VFGAFSFGDSVRVYRLQRRGISLDLQRDLTQPNTPLWDAWLAFVTQQAMGRPTYVLYDPHDGEAFVQVHYRPHQAAADVAYLAPSLAENHRAAKAWSSLLDAACVEAAGRGIQRVFASLPESGDETEVFQQSGFALYAGEDVYRLAEMPFDLASSEGPALRAQRPDDWPALQRLCVVTTPQRVRHAEGGIALLTSDGRNCQRFVLPGGNGDDFVAALSVCTGGIAHWMRVLVHPDARHLAGGLVHWALAKLAEQPAKPVYCNVRRYESGVQVGLESAGFEFYDARALMVKHTVAWVKTPAHELVPALQGGAELVPPVYRINGEREATASDGRLAAESKA